MGASQPSRVNEPIFLLFLFIYLFIYLFIFLYVTGTAHTVMLYVLLILCARSPVMLYIRASNFDLTLLWFFELQLEYTTAGKCFLNLRDNIELWAIWLLTKIWGIQTPDNSGMDVAFHEVSFSLTKNLVAVEQIAVASVACFAKYYILPLHSLLMRRNTILYIPKLSCICLAYRCSYKSSASHAEGG